MTTSSLPAHGDAQGEQLALTMPSMAPDAAPALPTLEQMHAFLALHYKHDRFQGRNGVWCPNYSWIVAQSALDDIRAHGETCISRHESRTGEAVWYGADLVLHDRSRARREREVAP